MRDLTRYRIYMAITILCGVIFLVVKLAYEWPQKFDHFGAFIKEGALENTNRIWGTSICSRKACHRARKSPGTFIIKKL